MRERDGRRRRGGEGWRDFKETGSHDCRHWQVQNLYGRPTEWTSREKMMLQFEFERSIWKNSLFFEGGQSFLVKVFS